MEWNVMYGKVRQGKVTQDNVTLCYVMSLASEDLEVVCQSKAEREESRLEGGHGTCMNMLDLIPWFTESSDN